MKPIKIPENNKAIDENDFLIIEKHYGQLIPNEIKEFIKKYNGRLSTELFKNCIDIDYEIFDGSTTNDSIIAVFNTKEIIEQLNYIGYIKEFCDHFELTNDYVEPDYLLPIFELLGSSIYIAIGGTHKNNLYLIDNGDFGISKLNIQLSDFIQES